MLPPTGTHRVFVFCFFFPIKKTKTEQKEKNISGAEYKAVRKPVLVPEHSTHKKKKKKEEEERKM